MWQDDPATIHRFADALAAVQESFNFRVPHDKQSAKMADVWPIENVWAIVKDKVKESEPVNKEPLRKVTKLRPSVKKNKMNLSKKSYKCNKTWLKISEILH